MDLSKSTTDDLFATLWHEARKIFLQTLKPSDAKKEEIRGNISLPDMMQSLERAQKKAGKAYGNKFVGTPIELRTGHVLQRFQYMLQMGDQVMRFAPESASYVWSAFRLLFLQVEKDFEFCEFVVNATDIISDIVFACQVHAKAQLKKASIANDHGQLLRDKVLAKIPPLLSVVLRFAYETKKLLESSGIRRSLSVLFGRSEELKDVLDDARLKREELERVADMAFKDAAINSLEGIENDTKTLQEFLRNTTQAQVTMITAVFNDSQKQREDRERKEIEENFNAQLKWLQSGNLMDLEMLRSVQTENTTRRHPDTCKWIFENEIFKQWVGNEGGNNLRSPLLLHGGAGLGKSILMSSVIEWLEKKGPEHLDIRPIVLFFFCKIGNDATQRGNKILLHLIIQLFQKAETDQKSLDDDKIRPELMEECTRHVENARNLTGESSAITFHDFQAKSAMQTLMADLAGALNRPVFVVVDALDECIDWNDGLLDALVRVAAIANVHVLISSRNEHDILTVAAARCLSIDVASQESIAQDVKAYISSFVNNIPKFRGKKPEFKERVIKKIVEKADGMFRYANLAVESLTQIKAVGQKLDEHMESLPDGMTGFYRQELQSLDKETREYILVALRWVVCGEGRISVQPIADELEDTFDDDDLIDGEEGDDMEPTKSRWSIDDIRKATRNFFKIDGEGYIALQHGSVREFVLREENQRQPESARCPNCNAVLGTWSTSQAGLKQGHLLMAIHCVKHLNHPNFQKKFLKNSSSPGKSGAGTERYEITHWHYHVREAEKLWPQDERNENEWALLYEEITNFLDDGSDAFKAWQKKNLSRRLQSRQTFTAIEQQTEKAALPIHIAARYGILHYMIDFHEQGGDIDVENELSYTPLHTLCEGNGDWVGLEFLVEHGADLGKANNKNKNTPLHIFVDCNGPSEKLKFLISKGGDPAIRNAHGQTILHLAVRRRNTESVKLILAQPTANVNARDESEETPLHWLLRWPNAPEEILRVLLEHGADVNEQNKQSQAPLYEACRSGNVVAARVLLEAHADVNDDELEKGRTALHEAVDRQNLPLVQLLLEFKADITLKDKFARDAISLAAPGSNPEILRILLEELKARQHDLHMLIQEGDDGLTPLIRSAAAGRKENVELLLTAGGQDLLAAQIRGGSITPLRAAAAAGYLEIVKLLVKNGGEPLDKDSLGRLPLDLLISRWADSRPISAERFIPAATYLAKLGPPTKFFELLDLAIENGATELCESAIGAAGQITWEEDKHGWTPLMLAVQAQELEIAHILTAFDKTQLLARIITKQEVVLGHQPSKWAAEAWAPNAGIAISDDGLEIGFGNKFPPARVICLTNHPVPFGSTRYYYEITVTSLESEEGLVGLGFSNKYASRFGMPGWHTLGGPSWGYHGDDGKLFEHTKRASWSEFEGPKWGKDDTVGCGIDFTNARIFYTKNGELVGDAFYNIKLGRLFPCVGMGQKKMVLKANFGLDPEVPFKYDPVTKYEKDAKKENRFKKVEQTS